MLPSSSLLTYKSYKPMPSRPSRPLKKDLPIQARLHNSFMKKVRLRSKLPMPPPRRERRKLQGTQT